MNENIYHYRVVFEPAPDTGGFWAFVPELPGCFTCGATLEETEVNVRDAIRGYLRVAAEEGILVGKASEAAVIKEVEIGF